MIALKNILGLAKTRLSSSRPSNSSSDRPSNSSSDRPSNSSSDCPSNSNHSEKSSSKILGNAWVSPKRFEA